MNRLCKLRVGRKGIEATGIHLVALDQPDEDLHCFKTRVPCTSRCVAWKQGIVGMKKVVCCATLPSNDNIIAEIGE